jgi:DNA-binding beta-propeller fold protein YncE
LNRIRTIRRLARILAGLASALLALSAVSPAAFAHRLPPPRAGTRLPQARTPIDTVATASMQAALRGLGGVGRAGPGGRGGSVVLDGSPGIPVANPTTGTVYVPIQCTTSSCTTPEHVVDIVNGAKCNATVISGCRVVARARVGTGPIAAAIDPSTHTVYVTNGGSNTVSVLKGARCNAQVTRGCRPVATIKVGRVPVSAVVNPATRTLYVANLFGGSISVINAAACNATITRGCGQPPRTVTDKAGPDWVDVNTATDTVYAANGGINGNGDTVSVINGATCNGHTGRGCGRVPATVTVGSGPSALAVDQASDTVYVANFVNEFSGGSVSVINGAACNGHTTAGCGRTPPAVPTGIGASFVVVNSALHTVFAVNQGDNTLSAINTRTCDGTATSGCRRRPPNQQAGPDRGPGFNPFLNAFALIPQTGSAYLVNHEDGASILSVTGISRCNATDTAGCRAEAPTAPDHEFLMTADPATNTLYAGNDFRRRIDVINGATCHAGQLAGCAPVATIPMTNSQANVGAIDEATHTLYASNPSSDTVAVINTATCNAANTTGCAQRPPTIRVGLHPNAPVINPRTQTMYVSYRTGSRVAVVKAATCNAEDTAGCGQTPAVVKVGAGAFNLAVSPATDTVYAPGIIANTVAVINGVTCNGTDHSGCGHLAAIVKTGPGPFGAVANDRTHTLYVTNSGDLPGTVSVINTATCNGTRTAGCRRHFRTMTTGISPALIAADTRAGMLYVNDFNSAAVTILNGSRCDAEVTSGCRAAGRQQAIGSGPQGIAVNPRARTVYVSEFYPPASPMSVFPTRH